MAELPHITTSSYVGTTAVDLNNLQLWQRAGLGGNHLADLEPHKQAWQVMGRGVVVGDTGPIVPTITAPKKENLVPRRLVQVFIADPNENVPLADSLLYRGEQKLTDLTDQELFFEVDIKTLLDSHNETRAKIVNKAVKERIEYLEPARIRDLKMVVVAIASF